MYFIDLGNSLAKIYSENAFGQIIDSGRIINWLDEHKEDQIIMCSVVPDLSKQIIQRFINVKLIDEKMYDKLIKVSNEEVYQKGSDRIVCGYAAIQNYSSDVIVVDAGTALTVDVYNNAEYSSGYIYPGFEINSRALMNQIPHLPEAKMTSPETNQIIDTSTQIGMGLIYGFIGAVKHLVNLELKKYPWVDTVVLTGGTFNTIINTIGEEEFHNQIGLTCVYEKNLLFSGLSLIEEKIRLEETKVVE